MGPLPFGFTAPGWGDTAALAVAGIGNGIAQYWWTRSLTLAPPSAVVPFNYLSLVWASTLGFLIWGDVPTTHLIIGAIIVVCSGLYILWRETVRHGHVRPLGFCSPQSSSLGWAQQRHTADKRKTVGPVSETRP